MFFNRVISNDVILLFLLVIVKTIVLFVLFSYPKSLTTYNDELIYFCMARSIQNGKGLLLHGCEFNYQYLGYPIFLAIAFIFNIVIRLKAIVLINSFLCACTSIPVYLIAKEAKLKRRNVWLVVLMSLVWSDSLYAGTFMAECLYYPVLLFALYYIIKSYNEKKYSYAVLAGLLSCFSLSCKVIARVIPIAFIATVIICFVIDFFNKKRNDKRNIIVDIKISLCYLLSFFGPIIVKLIYQYFGKILSMLGIVESSTPKIVVSYAGAVNSYFASSKDIFFYFIFALVYYFITSLLAFYFFPIITPMIKIKVLNEKQRFVYILGVVLLLGTIFSVTLTAGIKEDFGLEVPRERLRYLSAYLWLFIPVFISILERKEVETTNKKRLQNILYSIAIILIILIYKGFTCVNVVERHLLYYTSVINDLINNHVVNILSIFKIHIGSIIIGLLLFFFIFVSYKIRGRRIISFFFIIVSIINIASFYIGYYDIKGGYSAPVNIVNDMLEINDYIKNSAEKNVCVMYLSNGPFEKRSDVYDTYFDSSIKSYSVWEEDFERAIFENVEEQKQVKDIDIVELHFRMKYDLDKIDYFIVPKDKEDIMNLIEGAIKIDDVGGETYGLYKNDDPNLLTINLSLLTESIESKK